MADVMRIENTSDIALPTSHIQRRFAVLGGTNQQALASLSWLSLSLLSYSPSVT
jgi:hypothetical protein